MGCEGLKGRSHPTRGGWVSQVLKLNSYITLPQFFLCGASFVSQLCTLISVQMFIHCLSCVTDLTLYNRMLFHIFVSIFSSQPPLFLTFSLFVGAVVPQLDQCQGAVLLWRQCTDGCSVYSTSTEAFLQALSDAYASRLPERGVGFTDTGVCVPVVY